MDNSIKLDKKDLQLLRLLGENCRFQLSTLARALNLSKDTIRNRIKALEKNRTITHYNTLLNPRPLGYSKFQILIKFKSDIKNKQAQIEKLTKQKSISFINTLIGKYDIHIIIDSENIFSFDKAKSEIFEILKNSIQSYTVLTFFNDIKHTNLIPETSMDVKVQKNLDTSFSSLLSPTFEVEQTTPDYTPDSLDIEILKILTKNPRETLVQISKDLKYNRETIKQRIVKLIKNRVIMNFGANLSFDSFNYTTYFILIKTNRGVDERDLKNSFKSVDNLFYCAKTLGDYSLIAYILAKSPTQLKETIKKIQEILGDSMSESDLLIFDELLLYKQLPPNLLEEIRKND
ncbi:MAG: Lrp/AsnC family transcriptional regulator [Nanoarchaeota archaeon]|nr:Lrp/AsnC family transcriptional regulator [Nanoarchaeota archaeon]